MLNKDFLLLSEQYLNSSKSIFNKIVETNNKWVVVDNPGLSIEEYNDRTEWSDFNVIVPAIFLFYHGLEILLKGFLYIKNNVVDYDHNLTKIFHDFQNNYRISKDLVKILKKYVILNSNTSGLIKSYINENRNIKNPEILYNSLRYPFNKNGIFDHLELRYRSQKSIMYLKEIAIDISEIVKLSVALFNQENRKPSNKSLKLTP